MTTLDNLRKTAKRWLKALRDGDLSAIETLRRAYPTAPASPTLRDVQHALARERGFADWKALKANAEAALLIERGADVDARDSRYDATPLGWAAHFDHAAMVTFLSRFSRDFRMLCFAGSVDRVCDLLSDDPSLARQVDDEGTTPLWSLPDEEAKALNIVEALFRAGADPSVKSKDGRTAADMARRRGLLKVADRLDVPTA